MRPRRLTGASGRPLNVTVMRASAVLLLTLLLGCASHRPTSDIQPCIPSVETQFGVTEDRAWTPLGKDSSKVVQLHQRFPIQTSQETASSHWFVDNTGVVLLCLNGKPRSDLATDSIVFIPVGDEWQARELTTIH